MHDRVQTFFLISYMMWSYRILVVFAYYSWCMRSTSSSIHASFLQYKLIIAFFGLAPLTRALRKSLLILAVPAIAAESAR